MGGASAVVNFNGLNAEVTGTIAYSEADSATGRPAGNVVGFSVQAPSNVTDVTNATYQTDTDSSPIKISDNPNASGNPRIFWWYPDATAPTQTKTLKIDWDGEGSRPVETFTVNFNGVTLEPEPQPEP